MKARSPLVGMRRRFPALKDFNSPRMSAAYRAEWLRLKARAASADLRARSGMVRTCAAASRALAAARRRSALVTSCSTVAT
jgi:hypothetical protein